MMTRDEFKAFGHQLVDWMADYYENLEKYPVKSRVSPGDIAATIPTEPPLQSEPFSSVFEDFQEKILPGITHWQHPGFMAFFPANSSYPSVLAEMLTATLGAQCMLWETSPAAAELEEKMMDWLKGMMGLPKDWHGVIQDTASNGTLVSLLTAREKYTDWQVNANGFSRHQFRIYASTEVHSSIDKAVKIAGFGEKNLVKVAVDAHLAMQPEALKAAIEQDLAAGLVPLAVVAAVGSTSSTAIDSVEDIGKICQQYKLWLHVDAAYAGTATILPELRWMIKGLEMADTYVFNPHKWMLTNFDCTAYFVKDKASLIKTFSITPEYLKTQNDQKVNNYRDWGIQLGRRFRALKLWFVIRDYGVEGISNMIRNHLRLAAFFREEIEKRGCFQLLAPSPLNLICFRYLPPKVEAEAEIEHFNVELLKKLNNSGQVYLTHTRLNGIYTIRAVFGQPNMEKKHVENLLSLLDDFCDNTL